VVKTFKILALVTCLLGFAAQAESSKTNGVSAIGSTVEFAGGALPRPATTAGQSATQLPDGSWLLTGGQGDGDAIVADALIINPANAKSTRLNNKLVQPRAGHSATLLPDGSVWIFGGTDAKGTALNTSEQFDPATGTFKPLDTPGLLARTQHTATVLTDGRVLIAGGLDSRGEALYVVELYNPQNRQAEHFNVKLETARFAHLAALLPSNATLLWGGLDQTRHALNNGELFDPATQGFRTIPKENAKQLAQNLASADKPALLESTPAAEAKDIPVNQRLVVRFSKRMAVATLNTGTVTLLGPSGPTAIKPVPVEGGVLLFVTPTQELLPAHRYTLFIDGASDESGQALPFTAIAFDTAQLRGTPSGSSNTQASATTSVIAGAPANASSATNTQSAGSDKAPPGKAPADVKPANPAPASNSQIPQQNANPGNSNTSSEEWYPDERHFKGDWRARRGPGALQALPPLTAPAGSTALAGQALTLDGRALANVTLKIGERSTQTDSTGRFLLTNLTAGVHTLEIDGNHATNNDARYGFYQVRVDIKGKQTNVLDYTIWLSRLDPAGTMPIASPTPSETVLKSPRIPGLELHIPAGTVIRDHDGKIVTELNMTAIPTDHPPFPIPGVGVPVYFTVQPGAAVIQSTAGQTQQGAWLVYPNFSGAAPGTRIDFWNYDARAKGWYVYGQGTVSKDGKQVMPDAGVAIYELTGAMISLPSNAPPEGPPCGGCQTGDPVDVFTGLFIHDRTDLFVNDVIPLEVRRTYRQRDAASRAFGIGTNLSYDFFLVGDTSPWTYQDLILPDGGRIHYTRISAGTSYSDAVYQHTATATKYHGSLIDRGPGSCYWRLTFKDGAQICFPESYLSGSARTAAANAITDRNGTTLTLTRDGKGNLTKISTANSRSIQLTYDSSNRVTKAIDNLGRSFTYGYDAAGHLIQSTDPFGKSESYTYDASHNMLSVTDWRGNQMVANTYDANNRVAKQTYADGKTNLFSYTLDTNGKVTRTDVTNERGIVTRYILNASGYPSSIITALGLPEQQTVTYQRDAATNLVTSRTDALGRTTSYTYDAKGNTLSTTSLAGTPNAVTTTKTYTADFNQIASITDPLLHQTTFTYDVKGNLTKVTDANGNATRYAYNGAGQPTQITDALGKITTLTYDGADPVRVTDALNRSVNSAYDLIGRPIAVTDPLGNQSSAAYDALGRPSQSIDPMSRITGMSYDANGNLTQVKDAKGNLHQYAYDPRNWLSSYTDPLAKTESYTYDAGHNLTGKTDRKGQLTQSTYDNLDRRSKVTYADGSTLTYTYDQGNRLTKMVDSLNGTLTYAYDGLDRLTSVTTPKGSIGYTYHANGLRKSMTVSGQPALSYSYDAGNRLTRIDQAAGPANNNIAQSISFTYDAANRRTQTRLPNGITMNYSYDDANQLTGIVYKQADGVTVIGDLSYAYDAAGRRIKTGGSLAVVNLPAGINGATVDAANRLATWNGGTLSYDANGNLTGDGSNTYVWNARNQLVQIKNAGGTVTASFSYDATGRRQSKVINGTASHYLYDGANIVQELDGANGVVANYLSGGIDEMFARQSGTGAGAQTSSYLTDALGSTISLTDGGGGKVVGYTYDIYGNTTADAASGNPFQYTGRENDGNGLYYYRARYYSPQLQRFISEDPIKLVGGVNAHAYVGGNPLRYTDPLGLCPWCIIPALPYIPELIIVGTTWWAMKPPKDAYDPNGAKAPGEPGEAEGFCPPKRGPKWGKSPNGRGNGWVDIDGNVWVPTGPDSGSTGDAHGGPHWDVQKPGGGYDNVYPGGKRR